MYQWRRSPVGCDGSILGKQAGVNRLQVAAPSYTHSFTMSIELAVHRRSVGRPCFVHRPEVAVPGDGHALVIRLADLRSQLVVGGTCLGDDVEIGRSEE